MSARIDGDANGHPEYLRLGYRICPSCEREHPASNLTGIAMWCPQCNASSSEELALAIEEAPQRLQAVAADWRSRGLAEQADELDRVALRSPDLLKEWHR